MFLQASVILLTGGGRGYLTPLDYVPPRTMYPTGLHTPLDYVPPGLRTPRLRTPRTTYPPDYIPPDYVPPGLRTPGTTYPPRVDGLCAGGTHPTGMHSCYKRKFDKIICSGPLENLGFAPSYIYMNLPNEFLSSRRNFKKLQFNIKGVSTYRDLVAPMM